MLKTERTPEIMTPDQAAAYLQLNRETIYRYIREGKLLASKLGRSYRIPRSSVAALLWDTSTRPDIRLRQFSDEDIAAFEEADQLTGKAKEVARHFDRYVEGQSPGE